MAHPFPEFYDPQQVGDIFKPQVQRAIQAGINAQLPTAAEDKETVLLLLVDAQIDFIHPDGSLSVPGAVDDTRRVIEWLFRNVSQVTTIAASLDSHIPIQIFYSTWWVDSEGQHPQPYTTITSSDVKSGRWQPVYEPKWSTEYVQRLERQSKKELMIWPYHTLIGTEGHNLMPALYQAIAYHTAARQSQPIFINKGSIPKTEHYSMLEPEVKVPGHPQGEINTDFLGALAKYDQVYIAGQAKSHCVLETTASLMRYFRDQPKIISKWHVLIDCTSSVTHPEIDFEAMANKAYAGFEAQGLQIIKSTDPVS
ncbi:MAG: isochorismatase [Anaerolineaceae bacterium]|nr:isochorismatase [Anaerolineaceae bacterium]